MYFSEDTRQTRTFVAELQPSLCNILERQVLVRTKSTEQDFINRLSEQHDFIASSDELLGEDALCELVRSLAHFSKVEDL